jgi:selenocysteine lyase/cysteine desulfurase
MDPSPSYDLREWRAQVPLLERAIPMNHCSQAPLTHRTRAAAEAYLESWDRDGMDWDGWLAGVEAARGEFARLINADADEIAVTTSVSAATASIASALDFSGSRSVVVATEAEFPTVGHVWLGHQRYGARLRWVPVRDGIVSLAEYEGLVRSDTALVSACHGYYQTGYKQDLAAIAALTHAEGALLYVDAYQTLGTCPVDVKATNLDFLSAGCLKFLMGTAGIAFLYVKPDLLQRLEPAVTGWFGRAHPFAFDVAALDWSPTARRFDTGTPPVLNAWIAHAGLALINEVGPAAIEAWTDVLSARLVEGGRRRGLEVLGAVEPGTKTPTTAFRCPDDAHSVELALRRRGVLASARGPAIRLAPHFYSTLDDVERSLDALAETLESGG